MAQSPAITVTEKDQSQYTSNESNTILAVVGYSKRGSDTPTVVTSYADFENKFGMPTGDDTPFTGMAVKKAFLQTNQILFTRVIPTGVNSGETAWRAIGDTGHRIRIQAKYAGDGYNGIFLDVVTTANPIYDSNDPSKGPENYYDLNIYRKNNDGDSVLAETLSRVTFDNSGDSNYFITRVNASKLNGGSEWITIITEDSQNNYNYLPKTSRETELFGDSITFPNLRKPLGVVERGKDNQAGSSTAEWGDSAASMDTIANLVFPGSSGTIGDATSSFNSDWTAALDKLNNEEIYNFHLLITPDNISDVVTNKAIEIAESRGDFLYIADPPPMLDAASEVVKWHNGDSAIIDGDTEHPRQVALNSSYAATYWPWLTDFEDISGEYINSPPSIFIASKMLENDRLFDPWVATAGTSRGTLSAFDYEASPSPNERDQMYGGLNAVNPIVNQQARGLVIWGQKTLQRENTATNRINTRRMLIHVKKLLRRELVSVLFEPHDAISWGRATNIARSILEPIRQRRGISSYTVTFDRTTTSENDIQNNILRGRVRIVPINTIEFIDVGIEINPAGTTLTEV